MVEKLLKKSNLQHDDVDLWVFHQANKYMINYLRKLLDMPFEQWSVPYVIKLCDEYVIELLEIIYDKLKERDNRDFQEFCMKNKSSVNKSYSRMISYWNVYYRRQEYNFEKYIGRKIFTECFGYDKRFKR